MADPAARPVARTPRAETSAHLARRAALVLLRPALGRLPGPAHAGPHRARPAARHPFVDEAHGPSPARAARPDVARQRRSPVTAPGAGGPGVSHLPLRPLWLCRACAAPWPCAPAKLRLAREYAGNRVALCLYLSSVLHDAATDLHLLDPHGAPGPQQLFDRFIGWATPSRPGVEPESGRPDGGPAPASGTPAGQDSASPS